MSGSISREIWTIALAGRICLKISPWGRRFLAARDVSHEQPRTDDVFEWS
jgi:hypothetical protein